MARRPRTRPTLTYERRLILFIDFLGFKEVVEATKRDPAVLAQLVAALDDIGRIGNVRIFKSQQFTQFSDSVVMSYRVTARSGVFRMMTAIAHTVISLADRGFLVRGAVTIGDLHHTSRHVVGPAMVRAYEMESKEAFYPRVIIDPAVIRLARRHPDDGHSSNEEEGYVRDYIKKDRDGHLFIDYISWKAVVEAAGAENADYPEYLRNLGRLLRKGLAHDDTGVAKKYLWLHRRYLYALKFFRALPPDAPYRLANPDACGLIENLPRMIQLAREARSRVDSFGVKKDREALRGSQ